MVLAALAAVLLLGALLLWQTPPPPAPVASPAPVATAASPQPAAADTEALMQEARALLARGALIAPAGANAVETYLSVLQRDAKHAAARAALFEMQPVVADGIRGALAGADWPEAERLLALLQQLDPDSVLLLSLPAELQERRRRADQVEEARRAASAQIAPTSTSTPGPASAAPAAVLPAAPIAAVPAASPPAVPASAAAVPAPVTAPVVSPPLAEAPRVRETPARLLNNPPLNYPPQAKRQRVEGWVEVEVQIAANGDVSDARVIRAEPAGVFDREALRTAQRWRFAPRERDGQPVASTARRRVNFSLGS
jgi:protein TonB